MSEELIAADIREARTLPSRFYYDEEIFDILKSEFKGWQFALHSSEFNSQNIHPIKHIESVTGESIIVVKGDEVNSLSNICTHRGMRLIGESCNKKSFRCEYHGRTFEIDGKFRNMPEFEQAIGFPTDDDNLHKFPLEIWDGLYFTSLKSNIDIPWSELESRFKFLDIKSFEHDPSRDRDHFISANWMLYVDNYLEGFHIPFVHPELNQALDYSGYVTETFNGGVLQIGKAMEGDVKFDLPSGHPDFGQDIAAYYLWLYPNMMLNFYPWGLSLNIVVPVSPTETRVLYRGYVGNQELAIKGAGSILDTVETQDQNIVEAIQKNLKSSVYDRGRYSPSMEKGVHHFHRMISKTFIED